MRLTHLSFSIVLFSLGLSLVGFAAPIASRAGLSDQDIAKIRTDGQKRAEEFFRGQAGKPLKRSAIKKNWRNRGDFTRQYCQSVVLFAMRAFYLNEQLAEANAALREMCLYHLVRPQTFHEIHSFPTSTDQLVRLGKFYGPHGSKGAGRMDDKTYEIVLRTMWEWVKSESTLEQADVEHTQTWRLENSENHHAMHVATCWGFSMVLKEEPAYRDQKYNDGHTALEHYNAWTRYLSEYIRQRAAKGMLVEIDSPSYASASLRGMFSYYDFSDDPVLKRRAGQFLDLFWALWAEQQINAVGGGAKARCYPASALGGVDFINRMAWYIMGIGQAHFVHSSMVPLLTTTWQMPDVVMDIALDFKGRGSYEVRQRRMGLTEPGFSEPPHYRLRTDFGGILRYGWCTPDFIMGALMCEARPNEDWAAISSQNRWSGVIFRGATDARVFARTFNDRDESIYNGQWVAQAHGTQISQKLRTSKDADAWGIYFSKDGLSAPQREGRWLFAEAKGAYVAACVTQGEFEFREAPTPREGRWVQCADDFSPVILEVLPKTPDLSFADFQKKVIAQQIKMADGVLSYTGLDGDDFTFYTDQSHSPKINGRSVNYAPTDVFASPFIQSKWDSAIVTLQKGGRKLVLNFN